MEGDIIVMSVALVLNAFFSASETVFITFDKVKLLIWKKRSDIFSRALGVFFPRQERFVITILIGVNIANVTFSSLAAIYLVSRGLPAWLVVIISTFIILTFAEILPKAAALSNANRLVKPFSLPLWVFYIIFYPFVTILSSSIRKFFRLKMDDSLLILSRESLKLVILAKEGGMHSEGVEIAAGVLYFAEQKMREVMTPRTDIVAVPIDTPLAEIRELIIESGHSKIVVYGEDIDHIEGYVHALDLLNGAETVSEMVRPAEFVSEFTPVIEGLKILRDRNVGMLMVLDEYGGLDGIATIEDVAEELFGEIEDEYDRPQFQYRILGRDVYLIAGRAEIDNLNREINLGVEKSEGMETFGGWLITEIGRIPSEREIIETSGLMVEVLLADEKRVKMLKVKKVCR